MAEEENKPNELKEVTKEILGWEDNKLFRTLKHLTTRPGKMINEYCGDGKIKYLSPVVYFFGIAALDFYFHSISGLLDAMTKSSLDSIREVSKSFDTTNNIVLFLFSETGSKITQIPMYLFVTWLLYKKYNGSFKENSWFALYTVAHITLLTLPLTLYWYVTQDMVLINWASLIIAIGYWIWASKQFYKLMLGKAIFLGALMFVAFMLILTLLPLMMILILELN